MLPILLMFALNVACAGADEEDMPTSEALDTEAHNRTSAAPPSPSTTQTREPDPTPQGVPSGAPSTTASRSEGRSPSSPTTGSTEPASEGTPSSDPSPWRSTLFPEDWNPGHQDPSGAFLHDFSWAGYRHGETPPEILPEPIVDAVEEGADPTGAEDATPVLQALLDGLDEGGTLRLPAGRYRIDGRLVVRHSGVVIAGEGPEQTLLHLRWTQAGNHGASLRFTGSATHGEAVPLATDARSRSHRVRVSAPEAFSPGDRVSVGWRITDAFIEAHGMTGTWVTFNGQHRPFFRRKVVAVEGDEIVLDIPLRYDALVRDKAWLRHEGGHLEEVGLQDLSLSSAVEPSAAWQMNRHHALAFRRVRNSWVRRVGTFPGRADLEDHLQSGGVFVEDSDSVLIAESSFGPATNLGPGGNGYLVEVSRSNEVLIRDVVAEGGRHNFIQNWDFGTSGVVWLRTVSIGGRALPSEGSTLRPIGRSEFHHSLAMACLIDDSEAEDGWQAKNRHHYSSGAGHSATESVFWNLRGSGTLWSFQFGLGFVIGTAPGMRVHTALDTLDFTRGPEGTAPEDWREGVGLGPWLDPPSLYEAQRALRLAHSPEAWRALAPDAP